MTNWNRRSFIRHGALGTAAFSILPHLHGLLSPKDMLSGSRYKLSLAQWSLHRALQGGSLDHLDFAKKAVNDFGIYAVEYVNSFFKDKATDQQYLAEMNTRAGDLGVTQLLIMVDGEGGLAELDNTIRTKSLGKHYKWVDAAKTLGCHSIRVNAYGSSDDRAALHSAAVDGLGRLATYAAPMGINVIVENHGGLSSDGQWLSGVIKEVNMPNCGTLPDFGNFCLQHNDDGKGNSICVREYDRYKGVEELMPFAKAVSAKSHDFNAEGNETRTDFARMFDILNRSAYKGYIGVEYEGSTLSEDEGILATKKLLERFVL